MSIKEKFELWISSHPHLKGGNTLTMSSTHPDEYDSSWMESTFQAFKELQKEFSENMTEMFTQVERKRGKSVSHLIIPYINHIKKLEDALKLERKTVDFYADPENYITRYKTSWEDSIPEPLELIRDYAHPKTDWVGSVKVGGKLARETQSKRSKYVSE